MAGILVDRAMEIIRYRSGWLLSILCMIHFAYSCAQEISREMVIGFYVANYQSLEDTLEIKADGTYIHKYKTERSEELINTDRWTLEEWDGGPIITFEGWSSSKTPGIEVEVLGKKIGVGTERGRWPARVERSIFGNMRLPIDRDRGFYYLKRR